MRNSSGNTYANWLSGWPNTSIACLYCRNSYPNNSFCQEYYSISPFKILRNILTPWKIGNHFLSKEIPNSQVVEKEYEKNFIKISKSKKGFYYLVNDLLFGSGLWINSRYKSFIESYHPDIVFYFAKADAFILENLKYIRKHTRAKCVAFYADDVYGRFQKSNGAIYRIFERRFPKIVALTDYHFGASKLLCEVYSEKFKISISPLYKGCVFSEVNEAVNKPLRVVYAGNLYYGREKTLEMVAEALKTINLNGDNIRMEIYTSSEITSQIQKSLNIEGTSCIKGAKPYEDIKKIMRKADIVLHVESFEPDYMEDVRLSYSTKISDCLQSGSVFCIVGPRGIASVEETISIPGSVVISDYADITKVFDSLVQSGNELLSKAKSTNDYAKVLFHIDNVRTNLRENFKKWLDM